jgi:nitrite reductase/ring-hydroxylating ferredoxin subunit
MFRSIWLPALLSSQLPSPKAAPVRLKLLGEELVAFRDGSGQVGIVQSQCAHRLAPLFYGKVEQRGLRCSYHGWLYDTKGQCLEIPSDPTNATLCRKMKLRAYQVKEHADVVWVYMGEGAAPALPRFPWIDLRADQRRASVWLQETNWLQGTEGEIDSSHVSILHKVKRAVGVTRAHRPYTYSDPQAKLSSHETAAGILSVARRRAEDKFYWRVTQWMAPMFSFIPSAAWPIGGRAWVPIDDENTYCWDFTYQKDGPLPAEFLATYASGLSFPPLGDYQPFTLNRGSIIDTWVPKRAAHNDYMVDRALQEEFETTGIAGVNDQDRAMQEGMGRIVDRSKEKLVAGDIAVVAARRRLLDILGSAESLQQFRELVRDGSVYAVEPLDAVSEIADVREFLNSNMPGQPAAVEA